jgi:hypothetical protein
VDDTLAGLMSDRREARAYRVAPDGTGGSHEEPLSVTYLGA